MRELKFRAWHKILKRMIVVLQIDFTLEIIVFFDNITNDLGYIKFKDVDLMQFAGLQDKNGVDIYEGDILSIPNNNMAVVKWKNSGFELYRYSRIGQNLDLVHWSRDNKVIGNIYENPELLEV